MKGSGVSILSTGLVSAVGLSASSSCAAIRAKISNPTETRFRVDGEWQMGHLVPHLDSIRGINKLISMGAMAASECLQRLPSQGWSSIPMLLCVAETSRSGRLDDLEELLFTGIEQELGVRFHADSKVVAHGRISVSIALAHARRLLSESPHRYVLITAVDSLLTWPSIQSFGDQERLLTAENSDGFLPGEAASAVLACSASQARALRCVGIGFGVEPSVLDDNLPNRADGLVAAIRIASEDAGDSIDELDFRITDLSGEQSGFREAALALTRTLRSRKSSFDLWHPAESIGEVGAAIGPALLAVALAASTKGYAPGPGILVHLGNDDGRRAALILRSEVLSEAQR